MAHQHVQVPFEFHSDAVVWVTGSTSSLLKPAFIIPKEFLF